jgi:hypothetical protein
MLYIASAYGISLTYVLMCLCVMCLGGVRFTYVFMRYVLERGEVHLCVMCYVLGAGAHNSPAHNPNILYINIQFLLLLLLKSITQYQY